MATLLDYALTSVADVKESLGIDSGDSSQNNLIIRKINQATEMIEGFCKLDYSHHFKEATYTNEEFDATHNNQIVLRMRPVSAVSSFQYRNTSLNSSDWTTTDTQDYFINTESGVLELLYDATGGWNRYRVTYTAGYATIPSDLAEACVILASYLVENSSSGGSAVKSKQEGQRRVEYFDPGMGAGSLVEQLGIDDMVQRYVRYPL